MTLARVLIVFAALIPVMGCGSGAKTNDTVKLQALVNEQSKTIETLQTRVSELDSIVRSYGMTKDGLAMNVRSLVSSIAKTPRELSSLPIILKMNWYSSMPRNAQGRRRSISALCAIHSGVGTVAIKFKSSSEGSFATMLR